MDNINILVIISIMIGIIFIILSFVFKDKAEKNKNDDKVEDLVSTDEEAEKIDFDKDQVMEEISNKILELNDYSSFIKQELNDKHKELLFLYQLINEKEKNMKKLSNINNIKKEEKHQQVIVDTPKQLDSKNISNDIRDKNDEIHNLHRNGYSVTDIAKVMGLGRGEVKLILELGVTKEN
ncbi:DUF6115 domain-containing protein [Vallitalea guaymasensis]|uniref:DUF6115 domain-containing protein n=1 Tax=Vallitalea guaymasensis TaxID=1185412 RepID=UPI0023544227|nr:DUF6115 domain-containing protein [Vallitalea guaymasensis]